MNTSVIETKKNKQQRIYDYIKNAILNGTYSNGDRLPTEVQMTRQFKASRPTIGHALLRLQKVGLIERIAGSGTYVRMVGHTGDLSLLGLLIPDLGNTDIFEPLCGQMSAEASREQFNLLWGGCVNAKGDSPLQVVESCRHYVQQKVAGVFFAPFVEANPENQAANRQILQELKAAGIPIVLLDRDVTVFPHRSPYDLVTMDNYQAGYVLAQHFLDQGSRRVDFVMDPFMASTVERRIAGCMEALRRGGLNPSQAWIHCGQPDDPDFVRSLAEDDAVKSIICANDKTAMTLMQTLLEMGVAIPDRIRLAGFDDLPYTRFLKVSLTTMRQPCRELGSAALSAMISRIRQPQLPPRTILLQSELVVRESTAGRKTQRA